MRWTVGDLPPAVYWRRRAVVGVPVLVLLLTLATCIVTSTDDDDGRMENPRTAPSGSDGTKRNPREPRDGGTASPSSTASSDSDGGSNSPGGSDSDGGQDSPGGSDSNGVGPAGPGPRADSGNGNGSGDGQNLADTCADGDLEVTVSMTHPSYPAGDRVRIQLAIKNTSSRTCSRDLGADAQEVLVKQGDQRFWSSDDCATDHSSVVRNLAAGQTRTYWVAWSGHASSPGCPKDQAEAKPGEYQVFGRLGDVTSKPFKVKLR